MATGAQGAKADQRPKNIVQDHHRPKIIVQRITGGSMEVQPADQPAGEHNERAEEARRLRRLQLMMSMVMSVLSQDPDLTLEEAAEMAANARRAALNMFPDKELAYDILYRPRLQRLINERFRLQ
jgi:hypothetical protein